MNLLKRSTGFKLLAAMSMSLLFLKLVWGAEESLSCRLLIHQIINIDEPTMVTGNEFRMSKVTGVALCEDGRIAQRQSVYAEYHRGGNARFNGFSVYTFENGDTLTLKILGSFDEKALSANYSFVTGTGRYAEASGNGTLTSVAADLAMTSEFALDLQLTNTNP